MKKLLLTAFACMALSAHAAREMSCDEFQKTTGLSYGEAQDASAKDLVRLALSNAKSAEAEKGINAVLGLLSYCGLGEAKDVRKGLNLWEEASRSGDINSSMMLLGAYSGAIDGSRDELKLIKLLAVLERNAPVDFLFTLGASYHNGEMLFIEPNQRKAEQLWLRSAALGYVPAYSTLGTMYLQKKQYREALRWLELGSAAGDSQSRLSLGWGLIEGPEEISDVPRGVLLLANLVDKKYAPAAYYLGISRIYSVNVTRDYVEGLRLLRIAADQNMADAQEALARAYEYGIGVPKDLRQALQWRNKAASNGSHEAAAKLKPDYMYPRTVTDTDWQVVDERAKWYRLAAEDGTSQSQLNLAIYLAQASRKESIVWYQRAIALGNSEAMRNLGVIYRNEQFDTRDVAEGMRLLKMASAAGDRPARLILARAYEYGESVPKNLKLAYVLQFLSDESRMNRNDRLVAFHPSFEEQMTTDEIARAKQLIAEHWVNEKLLVLFENEKNQ